MSTWTLSKNEGSIDRIARVALGVVLVGLVFVGPETPWGLLGLIPLATGAVGTCPLYSLLGLSTCSSEEACSETSRDTRS